MSDKCECLARKALELLLDSMYAVILPLPDSIRDAMHNGRAALAAPCPCDRLRMENGDLWLSVNELDGQRTLTRLNVIEPAQKEIHDLRAENAALRRQVTAHQEWLKADSQYAENQRFRTENAELRESISGWLEQCRQLEPLLPNWRGGDRIIEAAAKEIEQLRAENAALRAWLGRDAIYTEIQQQAVESVERILRGDAEAK